MKQSKAERDADKRVERAYYKTCSGISINMLDIPRVFRQGRELIKSGIDDETLELAIRNFVETIRCN